MALKLYLLQMHTPRLTGIYYSVFYYSDKAFNDAGFNPVKVICPFSAKAKGKITKAFYPVLKSGYSES